MFRLFEARNSDLAQTEKTDDWEALADIVSGVKNFGESGATLRFKMFCDKNCINRKVKLDNLGVGANFVQELACILSVNSEIA